MVSILVGETKNNRIITFGEGVNAVKRPESVKNHDDISITILTLLAILSGGVYLYTIALLFLWIASVNIIALIICIICAGSLSIFVAMTYWL